MTQLASRNDELLDFQYKHLVINWAEMSVAVDNEPVHLTPIEYRLLEVLVRRRGWVIPYAQILREVWGPAYIGERANLKLYIWYLRRKIERDSSNPELIHTRRGIGYIFGPRSADMAASSVILSTQTSAHVATSPSRHRCAWRPMGGMPSGPSPTAS